jgi:hypothetical protein
MANSEMEKQKSYGELIMFYNKLDPSQKEQVYQRLARIIQRDVLPQQVENYLANLSEDNYQELIVQAKLLLIS